MLRSRFRTILQLLLVPKHSLKGPHFSTTGVLAAKSATAHKGKGAATTPSKVLNSKQPKKKEPKRQREEDQTLLPSVVLVGRPNVGKSAVYNRLVRRKEALVYDTPGGHVTRDYREGVAQLSDLRFKLFDTAGMEADSEGGGSLLGRAMALTAKLLTKSHLALFMLDARAGVQPMDVELARWLRRQSRLPVVLAANKCEGGHRQADYVLAAMGDAYQVGFGEAVAISAESGEGLADLYEKLQPHIDRATADLLADQERRQRERTAAAMRSSVALRERPEMTGSGNADRSAAVQSGLEAIDSAHLLRGFQESGEGGRGESGRDGSDVRWRDEAESTAKAAGGDLGGIWSFASDNGVESQTGTAKGTKTELASEAGKGDKIRAERQLEEEALAGIRSEKETGGAARITAESYEVGSNASTTDMNSATSHSDYPPIEPLSADGLTCSEGAESSDVERGREPVGSAFGAFSSQEAEGRQRRAEELEAAEEVPLQFAIAGRPNVGKSTLVNFLLGQDRVLTGPEPGLTRDSVQIPFEHNGRPIWLVDTAGWMHRSRLEEGAPQLSAADARKKIMRAHVVALMLDAQEITASGVLMKGNEVTLASWVLEEGRGLIILVNKTDCLSGPELRKLTKNLQAELDELLPQARGAPILTLSALKGHGAARLLPKVISLYDSWTTRLPTSRLNRWLQKVEMQMPNKPGYGVRVRYITQVKARPPTFVVFVSGAGEFPASRLRFLASGIRQEFGMEGVPIRMLERRVLRRSAQTHGRRNSL